MTCTGVLAAVRLAKAASGIMVAALVETAAPLDTLLPLEVAMELVAWLLADEAEDVVEDELPDVLVTVPDTALVDAVPLEDSPEVLT